MTEPPDAQGNKHSVVIVLTTTASGVVTTTPIETTEKEND